MHNNYAIPFETQAYIMRMPNAFSCKLKYSPFTGK